MLTTRMPSDDQGRSTPGLLHAGLLVAVILAGPLGLELACCYSTPRESRCRVPDAEGKHREAASHDHCLDSCVREFLVALPPTPTGCPESEAPAAELAAAPRAAVATGSPDLPLWGESRARPPGPALFILHASLII